LSDDSLLPPFFEPGFLDPALDRFVDEVLLDAAAARFVEPRSSSPTTLSPRTWCRREPTRRTSSMPRSNDRS
jgi:hypothetical protein